MEGLDKMSCLPFVQGYSAKRKEKPGVIEKRRPDPGLREDLEDRAILPAPGDPGPHLLDEEVLSLLQVFPTFDLDDQRLSPPRGNGIGTINDPDIGSKETGLPFPVCPGDPNRLSLVFENIRVKLKKNL